jgi:hypothetical protein
MDGVWPVSGFVAAIGVWLVNWVFVAAGSCLIRGFLVQAGACAVGWFLVVVRLLRGTVDRVDLGAICEGILLPRRSASADGARLPVRACARDIEPHRVPGSTRRFLILERPVHS